MNTYIVFFRALNVGGHHKIKMGDLKTMLLELGCQQVGHYIQSGNFVFQSNAEQQTLKQGIEKQLQVLFRIKSVVFLLELKELEQIVYQQPFQEKDSKKLHITFLSQCPDFEKLQKIHALNFEASEEFSIIDNRVYLYCPDGYGKSKLNNAFWERKLAMEVSTRNWKTTCKMLELGKALC